MRIVVQRASRGRVTVEGQVTGEIGRGLVLLVGVTHEDTREDADYLVDKVVNLRIFEDDRIRPKSCTTILTKKREASGCRWRPACSAR